MATTTSYTTSSCDRERVRRVRCVRDTYRESEACDPLPTGEGEVEEDCTMASPVHVCRAVCEGVSLLGGRLFYNMPITPLQLHTSAGHVARPRADQPEDRGAVQHITLHVVTY